jgi:hypothetical protein
LKVRLPQSFIQISARTSLSAGDLNPASREQLGQRGDALGPLAIDLGTGEAIALDVPDDGAEAGIGVSSGGGRIPITESASSRFRDSPFH